MYTNYKTDKHQRNFIYIRCLARLQECINSGDEENFFICPNIADVVYKELKIHADTVSIKDFPEILKHKPKHKEYHNSWFTNRNIYSQWTGEGNIKRRDILIEAIELTKIKE